MNYSTPSVSFGAGQQTLFHLNPIPLAENKLKLPSAGRKEELEAKITKLSRHINKLKTSLNYRRTDKNTVKELINIFEKDVAKLSGELQGNPLPKHFGKLYRAQMPRGLSGSLEKGIQELKDKKITRIFLLCQDEECNRATGLELRKFYSERGIKVVYFPVKDFGAWNQQEFNQKVNQLYCHLLEGDNIAVHCMGGIGRTGTIIAAVAAKVLQMDGLQAKAFVRKYSHPTSVETKAQEELICNFAKKKVLVAPSNPILTVKVHPPPHSRVQKPPQPRIMPRQMPLQPRIVPAQVPPAPQGFLGLIRSTWNSLTENSKTTFFN
jgi:protein-tyrosine phosphatase